MAHYARGFCLEMDSGMECIRKSTSYIFVKRGCIESRHSENVIWKPYWAESNHFCLFRNKGHTLCPHCKGREAELYCKTVSQGRNSWGFFVFPRFDHQRISVGLNEKLYEHVILTWSFLLNYWKTAVGDLEELFGRLWTQCQECQGSLHQDVLCTRYFLLNLTLQYAAFFALPYNLKCKLTTMLIHKQIQVFLLSWKRWIIFKNVFHKNWYCHIVVLCSSAINGKPTYKNAVDKRGWNRR